MKKKWRTMRGLYESEAHARRAAENSGYTVNTVTVLREGYESADPSTRRSLCEIEAYRSVA